MGSANSTPPVNYQDLVYNTSTTPGSAFLDTLNSTTTMLQDADLDLLNATTSAPMEADVDLVSKALESCLQDLNATLENAGGENCSGYVITLAAIGMVALVICCAMASA